MGQNSSKEAVFPIVRNIGRPRTVIAIGTPSRHALDAAKRVGARVTAVVADEAAKRALDGAAESVRVARLDRGEIDGDDASFDLAILEGLADQAAVLPRLTKLLDDGGHVLVASNRGQTLRAAREMLEAAGLEIMRVEPGPSALGSAFLRWSGAPDDRTIRLRGKYPEPTQFVYPNVIRPIERVAGGPLAKDGFVILARKPPVRPRKLSLTVGMLTLNEEEAVGRMIDEIRAVVPDAKILIVDSSSDRTPQIATEKGARVIRQLPPRGHGPAMERLMYEAARESDALVYIDCDFTYPTPIIARIRELLEDGADVVNATRTAKYPKAMPIPNFLANRVFAATAQIVHGIPTTDVHSGLRGYRSSVTRAFSFSGEGDGLPLDTLILPARSNYHVIEFPIDYAERVGVSKLAKLRGTLWTFVRIASEIGEGKRVGRRYRHLPG